MQDYTISIKEKIYDSSKEDKKTKNKVSWHERILQTLFSYFDLVSILISNNAPESSYLFPWESGGEEAFRASFYC